MVSEACLPSNAYYPRTPDYTLYSGVHVCWSEHSDSSFVYGFMSFEYGLGIMTATTYKRIGYSLDIMRQTACLVVNPIIVDGYASLFNCRTAVRVSDAMAASS